MRDFVLVELVADSEGVVLNSLFIDGDGKGEISQIVEEGLGGDSEVHIDVS